MALSYIYNMAFGIDPNIMAIIAVLLLYITPSVVVSRQLCRLTFCQGIMQLFAALRAQCFLSLR